MQWATKNGSIECEEITVCTEKGNPTKLRIKEEQINHGAESLREEGILKGIDAFRFFL